MFHNRAAATAGMSGNARSPRLDRLVAGTNRVDVERARSRTTTCLGVGRQVQCLGEVLWSTTVPAAILNLFESKIALLDPPSPKTLP